MAVLGQFAVHFDESPLGRLPICESDMGVVADVAALFRALLERHLVGHALGAAERRRTRRQPGDRAGAIAEELGAVDRQPC